MQSVGHDLTGIEAYCKHGRNLHVLMIVADSNWPAFQVTYFSMLFAAKFVMFLLQSVN